MKFDLTGKTSYVTRDGFQVLEIMLDNAGFTARIAGQVFSFHANGQHRWNDTHYDVMTAEEQRADSVPNLLAKLDAYDRSIVTALVKDNKLILAVRYVREKLDVSIMLARAVAEAS